MNTLKIATSPQSSTKGVASTWKDWLGITASVGCAIHCAAMPFVIAYLPALGLSFLADEAFHKWMALVCFLIALIAFVPGLLKHGSWVPVSIGTVGLAVITYAAFGLSDECCASCKAAQTGTANQVESASHCSDPECQECASEQPQAIASSDVEPACCEECEAAKTPKDSSSKADSAPPAKAEQVSFLSLIAPWVTPIGGVLLVAAHLLNRRYGYVCGCCETQTTSEPVPQSAV